MARPPGDESLSHALVTSRGGILSTPLGAQLTPRAPGTLDDPGALAQWEPLIRFNVALMEATSTLRFHADTATNTATLNYVDWHAPAGGVSELKVIAMGRPPSVQPYFARQLDFVMGSARHRGDREAEIVVQLAPQTPFWAAVAHLQPHRHKATLELLELALAFASSLAMRFKHALALPRPAQFSPKVQAMVPTPEHSTLPSGHATEAYMAAHVLRALLRQAAPHAGNAAAVFEQLEALAARIADNRMVAGVHFPADSIAGRMLGATTAEFLAYLASGDARPLDAAGAEIATPGWHPYDFVPLPHGNQPFVPGGPRGVPGALQAPVVAVAQGGGKRFIYPALNWFWRRALDEWL